MIYVFCDTMVFLHYRLFPNIDFSSLLHDSPVTLVMLEQVAHEIDSHKDSNPRKKIRERAGRVNVEIARLIDRMDMPSMSAEISNGYHFLFLSDNSIDLVKFHLNPQSNDHKIIAAILDFKNNHSDAKIVFFTHDNGATIVAKTHGISTQRLPDDLKLQEECSEDERYIKDLEARIAEYENAIPHMDVIHCHSNSRKRTYSKNDISVFTIPTTIKNFETICAEHPPLKGEKTTQLGKDSFSELFQESLKIKKLCDPFSEILGEKEKKDEIIRYTREREVYLEAYKKYLKEITDYREKIIFSAELQIVNKGTVPARGVEIEVYFPEDLQICTKETLLIPPKPPVPPIHPRTTPQILVDKINCIDQRDNRFYQTKEIVSKFYPPVFIIDKNPDGDWVFKETLGLIKHGEHVVRKVKQIILIFKSANAIRNFSAKYIISGENIPHAQTGNLDFIFDQAMR